MRLVLMFQPHLPPTPGGEPVHENLSVLEFPLAFTTTVFIDIAAPMVEAILRQDSKIASAFGRLFIDDINLVCGRVVVKTS